MIAEQPIPELGRVTASAITEVLATQFNLLATASTPGDKPVTGIPEQCLIDSATLCGGRVAGDVHLQLPEAFATKLTALLLGRSATSATDECVADVAGRTLQYARRACRSDPLRIRMLQQFEHPPVVRGHRLELEISPGAKTCWSDWTCEEHLLTVALQFRFKSR